MNDKDKEQVRSIAHSYLSHEDRNVRFMAIALISLVKEKEKPNESTRILNESGSSDAPKNN